MSATVDAELTDFGSPDTDTEPSRSGHSWPSDPVVDVESDDDIWELDVADRVWIDGTEYTVVGNGISFLGPTPKVVIGENGEQNALIAGTIRGEDAEGVTWRSNVSDKERDEISSDDIVAPYSKVFVTETPESLEHVHEIVPDAETRACPACDADRSGRLQHSEIQNGTAVEIRRCTDTDCKHIYRYEHPIDMDDEAELIVRDDDAGRFRLKTVTGFYIVEDQDDFKFPVDTHDGKHDGYRTATQIADHLNPKMIARGINDLLQQDGFTAEALLEIVAGEIDDENDDGETIDAAELPIADAASDMSGRELLTSAAFYEFVTDTITVSGDVSHLNSDDHEWKTEDEVTWHDDVREWEQKVEFTYTQYTPDDHTENDFRISHQWSMDKYDMTEFL